VKQRQGHRDVGRNRRVKLEGRVEVISHLERGAGKDRRIDVKRFRHPHIKGSATLVAVTPNILHGPFHGHDVATVLAESSSKGSFAGGKGVDVVNLGRSRIQLLASAGGFGPVERLLERS